MRALGGIAAPGRRNERAAGRRAGNASSHGLATLPHSTPACAPQGLTMFPAMVIVPTLQIAWTLFSIVSGMLYFREYRDFSPLSSAMFCVGLLVSGTNYAVLITHGTSY